jgi:hypothetical protein
MAAAAVAAVFSVSVVEAWEQASADIRRGLTPMPVQR